MTQQNNQIPQAPPQMQGEWQPQPKKRLRPIVVVLALVIAVCLVGAGFGIAQLVGVPPTPPVESSQSAQPPVSSSSDSPSASSSAAPSLPANPIDFNELKKQNEDIYAWITVPDTNVNYAIVRYPEGNEFYLDHNESKEEDQNGAIFTEDYNTMDFKDGVTLVYGHNMADGSMFNNLHLFEDPAFFDEHDTFTIYLPGHILTYKIVSAYVADDRHVLYRYNYFQSYDDLRAFEKEILDPHSMQQNTRDVSLDDSSKFVVLSTCNSGALEEHERYLVCGVLTDDQPTE